MKAFGGIDPGKTGGMVFLREDGRVLNARTMPLVNVNGVNVFDFRTWSNIIKQVQSDHSELGCEIASLYIEVTFQQITRERGTKNVRPMRGAHEFAKVSGAQLAGAYFLADGNVTILNADTWRKTVGLVLYDAENTWKKASREAVKRLFPNNPELAKHPGLADAALMALAALEDFR